MKKTLCLLLSVVIILSVVSITSVSASASPKVVNNVISTIYDNKIYYLDTVNHSIYTMDKNGKSIKKIVTGEYYPTEFSIYRDRIFFSIGGTPQSVNLNGEDLKTYNLPENSNFICVYNNFIYYYNGKYIKKKNLTTDLTTHVYTCSDEYPKITSDGRYLFIDESDKNYIGFKLFDLKTQKVTKLISKHINQGLVNGYYRIEKYMIKGNNLFFIAGCFQGSGYYYYGDFYKVGLNGKKLKRIVNGCGTDFYIKGKTIYLSSGFDGYAGNGGCVKCSTSGKVIKKYGAKYIVSGVSKGNIFFKKAKSNNLYYGKNLSSKKILIKGKKNTKRYTNFYQDISIQGKNVLLAYGVNAYPDGMTNIEMLATTFKFIKKKI